LDYYEVCEETTDYYLQHNTGPPGVGDNIWPTRVLSHIFKTEVVDIYGWTAFSSTFNFLQAEDYPLRQYEHVHTWGGFLNYLGDQTGSDLNAIFASYGLPTLQWFEESQYQKGMLCIEDDEFSFRVKCFDREGDQAIDVKLHIYSTTSNTYAMTFVEGDSETGWTFEVNVTLTGDFTYAFSARDGAHSIFQAIGIPTLVCSRAYGNIYVTIKNLDDDIHSVLIYVDGQEWGWLDNIPHFATYSTPNIEVTGNMDHEVEIFWEEPDEEVPVWHSKRLIEYVGSTETVEFEFELDPIFKVIQILNIPDFPLADLWEAFGFTTKVVYANLYEVTSDGHFEIYYDPGSPYISQSYLDYVGQAALKSWEQLVPYLGSPYDLDGDGRIEILITNLNYMAEGSYSGALGYCIKPPSDPNGLGMIYIDDNIHMWTGDWKWINSTVSHEFTHMIQFSYDSSEDDWIMEGMAQFGSDYVWEMDGQLQRYVTRFADNPDVQLDYPWSLLMDKYQALSSWYCASYVFFEFLAEKFGPSIIRTVLEKTVDYDGKVAVEEATSKSFSELFGEFAVWNYVNEYSGVGDGGTTFEGTSIYAESFETHYLPGPPAYLHGSGSFDDRTFTTDYINFTSLVEPFVEVAFYGEANRAFEVKVILIVGDFSSYEVRGMTLSDNEGSLLIENALAYSQFALVVVRHFDGYSDADYSWDVKAYAETMLSVRAESPTNILVTAPNGLRVGYDAETETVVNEIPGATYSGPDTQPQEIFIPNPLLGNYTVQAFGTGTGSYTITLESTANGSIVDSISWEGIALPDQQYTQTIDLGTDGELTSIYDLWTRSFTGTHPIVDFAVYNGILYAASDNNLYVYDGNNWTTIQAPAYVLSLVPYEGKLYVGGKGALYSYNGTDFTLVFSTSGYVKMLGIYNGTLYAGTVLDNPPTLFYCNGSADNPDNWYVDTAFSIILNFSGPFGSIDSFAVYNDNMYVTSGGTVYSYNGTDWSIVTTYVDVSAFLDMKVSNGKLYLATRDQAWRKPYYLGYSGFSGRVIEFDGSNWTPVFDYNYWIYSLETYNDKLYVGTANKIFTYNGTYWKTSFNSEEGSYYAISFITFNNTIYAGMGNGCIFTDPPPENMNSKSNSYSRAFVNRNHTTDLSSHAICCYSKQVHGICRLSSPPVPLRVIHYSKVPAKIHFSDLFVSKHRFQC
jgi:hypothetical protein